MNIKDNFAVKSKKNETTNTSSSEPQVVSKRGDQYIPVSAAKAKQAFDNGLTIRKRSSRGTNTYYQKNGRMFNSTEHSKISSTPDFGISTNPNYYYTDSDKLDYTQLAAYGRDNGWTQEQFQSIADAVNNPGSDFYNPYFKGAVVQNKAADYLREYFNYDGPFDADFFQQTKDIQNYLIKDSNTTLNASTPSSKTGTPEQWAAYYWVQLQDDLETQNEVNQQWSDLRTNLAASYKSFETIHGRKPTYQEFVDSIDMSKYSQLQKIDDSRNLDYNTSQALVQLNTGTYYSKESLAGLYYTLYNGGDISEDRDYTEDSILYWMSEYEEPDTTTKLQEYGLDVTGWTDETYEAVMAEARKTGDHELYELLKATRYQNSESMASIDKTDYLSERFGYYRDDNWFAEVKREYAKYWEQMKDDNGDVQKPSSKDDDIYQAAWQAWQACQMQEDTDLVESQANAVYANISSSYATLQELDNPPLSAEEFKQMLETAHLLPRSSENYPELLKYMDGDLSIARTVFISDEEIDAYIQKVWDDGEAAKQKVVDDKQALIDKPPTPANELAPSASAASSPVATPSATVSATPTAPALTATATPTAAASPAATSSPTATATPTIIEPEEAEDTPFFDHDLQAAATASVLKRVGDATKLGKGLVAMADAGTNISDSQWSASGIATTPIDIDLSSKFNSTVASLWYGMRSDNYAQMFGAEASTEACIASDPVLKNLCSAGNVDLTQIVTGQDILDMLNQQTLSNMAKPETTIADGVIQAAIPSADELMTGLQGVSGRYGSAAAKALMPSSFDAKSYNSTYELAKEAGCDSKTAAEIAIDSTLLIKPNLDSLKVGVEVDDVLSVAVDGIVEKITTSSKYPNAVAVASKIAMQVFPGIDTKDTDTATDIAQLTGNIVVGLSDAATPAQSAITKDFTNDVVQGDISSQDIIDGLKFYAQHSAVTDQNFSSFPEGSASTTDNTELIDETATPYGSLITYGVVDGHTVMTMNDQYWVKMLEENPEGAAQLSEKYNSNLKQYFDGTDMPALIAEAVAQYGHDDAIYQASEEQVKQNEGIANKMETDLGVQNRFDYWFNTVIGYDDGTAQYKYSSEHTELYYTLSNYSNYFTPEEALALSAAWSTGYLSLKGAQAVIASRVSSMSVYTANYINNQSDITQSQENAETFFADNKALSQSLQAAYSSGVDEATISKARTAQESIDAGGDPYYAVANAGLTETLGITEGEETSSIMSKLNKLLNSDNASAVGESLDNVVYTDEQLNTLEKMYSAFEACGALGFDLIAYADDKTWSYFGVDFDSVGLGKTAAEYMDDITDSSWREAFGNEGMDFVGTGGESVLSNMLYQGLQSVGNVPALLSRQFRDFFDFLPGVDAYQAGDGSYYDRVKTASRFTSDTASLKATESQQAAIGVGKTVISYLVTKGIGSVASGAQATSTLEHVADYQSAVYEASVSAASTAQGIGNGVFSGIGNAIDDVVAAGYTAIRGIDAAKVASMMPRLISVEANAYESNRNSGQTVASSFMRAATETVLEGAWMSSTMQGAVGKLQQSTGNALADMYGETLSPYVRSAAYPIIDVAARTASTFAGRITIEGAKQIADNLYDAADLVDEQNANNAARAAMTGKEQPKQNTFSQYFKALFEVIADPDTADEWRERLLSSAWIALVAGVSALPQYFKSSQQLENMLATTQGPTEKEAQDFVRQAASDLDANAATSEAEKPMDVAVTREIPAVTENMVGQTGTAYSYMPYTGSTGVYGGSNDTTATTASSAQPATNIESMPESESTTAKPAQSATQNPSDAMTDLVKKVILGEATSDEVRQTVSDINAQLTGAALQPSAQSPADKLASDTSLQPKQSDSTAQTTEDKPVQKASTKNTDKSITIALPETATDRAVRISQEAAADANLSPKAMTVAEFMAKSEAQKSSMVAKEVATQTKEKRIALDVEVKKAEEGLTVATDAANKTLQDARAKQSEIYANNQRIQSAISAAVDEGLDPNTPSLQNTIAAIKQQNAALQAEYLDLSKKAQEAEEEHKKKEDLLAEVRRQAEALAQQEADKAMTDAREKYETAKGVVDLLRNQIKQVSGEINVTRQQLDYYNSLYGSNYTGTLDLQSRLDSLESLRTQLWMQFRHDHGPKAAAVTLFTPDSVKNYESLASRHAALNQGRQETSGVPVSSTARDPSLDRIESGLDQYQGKMTETPDDPNREKKPYEIENAQNAAVTRAKAATPQEQLNRAASRQLGIHDPYTTGYTGTDMRTREDEKVDNSPTISYGGTANDEELLKRDQERMKRQKWEGKTSAADLLDLVDPRNAAVTGVDSLAVDEVFSGKIQTLADYLLTLTRASEKNFWDFAVNVPVDVYNAIKTQFGRGKGGDAYTHIFFRYKAKSDEDIESGLRWINRKKIQEKGLKDKTVEYQKEHTPLNMEALNSLGLAPIYVFNNGEAFILTTIEHTGMKFHGDELQAVRMNRELQELRSDLDGYKKQFRDIQKELKLVDGELLNLPPNSEENAKQRQSLLAQKNTILERSKAMKKVVDDLQQEYEQKEAKLGIFGAEWFLVKTEDVAKALDKLNAAIEQNAKNNQKQKTMINGKQSERYTLSNGDTVYLPVSSDPADYAELDDEQLREIMTQMNINDPRLKALVEDLSVEELQSWLHKRLPKKERIKLNKLLSEHIDWLGTDAEQMDSPELQKILQEQLFDVLQQEREGIADTMTREELIAEIVDMQSGKIGEIAESVFANYTTQHLREALLAVSLNDNLSDAEKELVKQNIQEMPRKKLINDLIAEWNSQDDTISAKSILDELPYVKFDGYSMPRNATEEQKNGLYVARFVKDNGGYLWDNVQPDSGYYVHQSLLALLNRYRNMLHKSNNYAAIAKAAAGIENTKTDAQKKADADNRNRAKALLLKFYDSEFNGGKTLGTFTIGEYKELTALLGLMQMEQEELQKAAAEGADKNRAQYVSGNDITKNTRSTLQNNDIDVRINELTSALGEAAFLAQRFPLMDFGSSVFTEEDEVELTCLLALRSSQFATEKMQFSPLEAVMARHMPKPVQRFTSAGIKSDDPKEETALKKKAEENDKEIIDLTAIKSFVTMVEKAKDDENKAKETKKKGEEQETDYYSVNPKRKAEVDALTNQNKVPQIAKGRGLQKVASETIVPEGGDQSRLCTLYVKPGEKSKLFINQKNGDYSVSGASGLVHNIMKQIAETGEVPDGWEIKISRNFKGQYSSDYTEVDDIVAAAKDYLKHVSVTTVISIKADPKKTKRSYDFALSIGPTTADDSKTKKKSGSKRQHVWTSYDFPFAQKDGFGRVAVDTTSIGTLFVKPDSVQPAIQDAAGNFMMDKAMEIVSEGIAASRKDASKSPYAIYVVTPDGYKRRIGAKYNETHYFEDADGNKTTSIIKSYYAPLDNEVFASGNEIIVTRPWGDKRGDINFSIRVESGLSTGTLAANLNTAENRFRGIIAMSQYEPSQQQFRAYATAYLQSRAELLNRQLDEILRDYRLNGNKFGEEDTAKLTQVVKNKETERDSLNKILNNQGALDVYIARCQINGVGVRTEDIQEAVEEEVKHSDANSPAAKAATALLESVKQSTEQPVEGKPAIEAEQPAAAAQDSSEVKQVQSKLYDNAVRNVSRKLMNPEKNFPTKESVIAARENLLALASAGNKTKGECVALQRLNLLLDEFETKDMTPEERLDYYAKRAEEAQVTDASNFRYKRYQKLTEETMKELHGANEAESEPAPAAESAPEEASVSEDMPSAKTPVNTGAPAETVPTTPDVKAPTSAEPVSETPAAEPEKTKPVPKKKKKAAASKKTSKTAAPSATKAPEKSADSKATPTDSSDHIVLRGKKIPLKEATPDQAAQAAFEDIGISPATEAELDAMYPDRTLKTHSRVEATSVEGTTYETDVEELTKLDSEEGINIGRDVIRRQKAIVDKLTEEIDHLATTNKAEWMAGASRWAAAKQKEKELSSAREETTVGTPEYAQLVAQLNAIRTYQLSATGDRESYERWEAFHNEKDIKVRQRDLGKKMLKSNSEKVNGSQLSRQIAEGNIKYDPKAPVPGAVGGKSGLEIARELLNELYSEDGLGSRFGKTTALTLEDVSSMLEDKFDPKFFIEAMKDAKAITKTRHRIEESTEYSKFKLRLVKALLSNKGISEKEFNKIALEATNKLIETFQGSVSRKNFSGEGYEGFQDALSEAKQKAEQIANEISGNLYEKYSSLFKDAPDIDQSIVLDNLRHGLLETQFRLNADIESKQEMLDNLMATEKAYYQLGNGDIYGCLSDTYGGQLPAPLMNIFLGMLYDASLDKKNAVNLIEHVFQTPEGNIEKYSGQYAPFIHAVFVAPTLKSNDKQTAEIAKILRDLEDEFKIFEAHLPKTLPVTIGDQTVEMTLREIVGRVIDDRMTKEYRGIKGDTEYIVQRLKDFGYEVDLESDMDKKPEDFMISNKLFSSVKHLVNYGRNLNDSLYERTNKTLLRTGHRKQTFSYRGWYMHHYNNDGDNKFLAKVAGIHTSDDMVPDAIQDDTSKRTPSHMFNAAALERQGNKTEYDFAESVRRSLTATMNTIHQTANVDRLRQLAQALVGTPKKDERGNVVVENNKTVFEGSNMYEYDVNGNKVNAARIASMSNEFVNFAQRAANKRTGKLDRVLMDTNTETFRGRTAAAWMQFFVSLKSQASVGLNPLSAVTNFAPLKFLMGLTTPAEFNSAVASTITHLRNDGDADDDYVAAHSTFLRGRTAFSPEESTIQSAITSKSFAMHSAADAFTANVMVRAFFNHEMAINGGNAERALAQAEKMTRKILLDKSRVGRSRFYENKLGQFFGQFQQESVNEMFYIGKDMLNYAGGKLPKYLLMMFAVLTFNALSNFLRGSDSLPDLFGLGVKAFNTIKDDEKTPYEKALDIGSDAASNLIPIDFFTSGKTATTSSAQDIIDGIDAMFQGDSDIWDFIALLGANVFPGGTTVKRSVTGVESVLQGYAETSGGKVKYPTGTPNVAKVLLAAIGGTNILPEAKGYIYGFDDALSLSDSDTYRALVEEGGLDPTLAWSTMRGTSDAKSATTDAKETAKSEDASFADIVNAADKAQEVRSSVTIPSDIAPWAAKAYKDSDDNTINIGIQIYQKFGGELSYLTYPTKLDTNDVETADIPKLEMAYRLAYDACIRDYVSGVYGDTEDVKSAKKLASDISKIKSTILDNYKKSNGGDE